MPLWRSHQGRDGGCVRTPVEFVHMLDQRDAVSGITCAPGLRPLVACKLPCSLSEPDQRGLSLPHRGRLPRLVRLLEAAMLSVRTSYKEPPRAIQLTVIPSIPSKPPRRQGGPHGMPAAVLMTV
jgi:hypothetical protein